MNQHRSLIRPIWAARAAQECTSWCASRPRKECYDHAPHSWASNRVAETVSRRPRSPKPRKTKHRRRAKQIFSTQLQPGIRPVACELGPDSLTRQVSSRSGVFPLLLFICSKGGLETDLSCPISSVVFLHSPGFSMLLVREWRRRAGRPILAPVTEPNPTPPRRASPSGENAPRPLFSRSFGRERERKQDRAEARSPRGLGPRRMTAFLSGLSSPLVRASQWGTVDSAPGQDLRISRAPWLSNGKFYYHPGPERRRLGVPENRWAEPSRVRARLSESDSWLVRSETKLWQLELRTLGARRFMCSAPSLSIRPSIMQSGDMDI